MSEIMPVLGILAVVFAVVIIFALIYSVLRTIAEVPAASKPTFVIPPLLPAEYNGEVCYPCAEFLPAGAFVCDNCGENNYFSLVILDEVEATPAMRMLGRIRRRVENYMDGDEVACYPEYVTCRSCDTVYALMLPTDPHAHVHPEEEA